MLWHPHILWGYFIGFSVHPRGRYLGFPANRRRRRWQVVRVIIEMSDGEQRMFTLSLDREAEKKLLKRIDDNEERIENYNTLAEIFSC